MLLTDGSLRASVCLPTAHSANTSYRYMQGWIPINVDAPGGTVLMFIVKEKGMLDV